MRITNLTNCIDDLEHFDSDSYTIFTFNVIHRYEEKVTINNVLLELWFP